MCKGAACPTVGKGLVDSSISCVSCVSGLVDASASDGDAEFEASKTVCCDVEWSDVDGVDVLYST